MLKPKKICSKCRKIKGDNCSCPDPIPFEGINRSNQPFYNSRQWRAISKNHKQRNPLCIICLQEGKTVSVDICDHIISIDKGGSKLDPNNLQSLCSHHHNQKSGKSK